MHVLLGKCDSEVVWMLSLCFDMRWAGTRVLHTKPGEYGIEMTRARSPDIVILDLASQNMDGFDVCVQIQSSSDVHIVMLTVKDTLDETMKGLDLGAGGYLTKPFKSVDFLAMDSTLLRLSHMSHPPRQMNMGKWEIPQARLRGPVS